MIYILIIIGGIILDRLTKIYAINNLIENPVHTKFFNFVYLENTGAAFGILQRKRTFFIILTCMVLAILLRIFIKKFKTNKKCVNVALSMIMSGALGNFYDRLIKKYVVDFIEFSMINFPVFNVADSLITIGCAILIIYILFFDKEEA